MKPWDEKLDKLSFRLAELSDKAASASDDAKAAREMKTEALRDSVSTAKGDMIAFEEKVKEAEEEGKSKISTALLKAKMTHEAKVQDRKDNRDKAFLELYMEDRALTAVDCLDVADYMIANAIVNYLELVEAAIEYNERFGGEAEAETPAE